MKDTHLQILDPLPTLLKRHATGIVDEDDDVEECELDQVAGQLDR